jgi:GNAT superfamily N-acetyltransferase
LDKGSLLVQWTKDIYSITDDRSRVVLDTVVRFLRDESYWARDFPAPVIARSIENSLCFSMFDGQRQIGFARFITDYAVFGYLEDVFVDTTYRGRGLGTWFLECILAHPDVHALRKLMLATEDAQTLYGKFGFTELAKPEMVMERYNHDAFVKTG